MKVLDLSRDEPTIRYEIEKKKYNIVVCSKGPLIIKLEWNSIGVIAKEFNLRIVLGVRIVYLSPFVFCGFYSPCIHCLNEHMHLWDIEPLVLMAVFYCLTMAIRPLVPIRYSLAILDIECLLWLRSSLISVRYTL